MLNNTSVMTQTPTARLLFAGVALVALAAWPASGQDADTEKNDVPDVIVSVKGMVCQNCAYAVEKRVGKLEGVSGVEAHLDDQQVYISLVPGKKVNEDDLRKAVLDAGFEPVEVRYAVADGAPGGDVE